MKKNRITNLLLLAVLAVLVACAGNRQEKKADETMDLKKDLFGTVDGKKVYQYTLTNDNGMKVKLITYGGIITQLWVPDKNGKPADVVLGYDSLQDYLDDSPYFGAIIGRYGNRIANGRFTLDGKTYQLATNNGPNHLHGGIKGFDKVVWNAKDFVEPDRTGVVLSYFSKNGEEGYPGNLHAEVTYTLTNDNELKIDYKASSDAPTIINMTNHSYFNLAGQGNGDILDEQMQIMADRYLPVDQTLIPTGEERDVKESAMDFTVPRSIGDRIDEVEGGYDHNYVLNNYDSTMRLVARVTDPKSGRTMEVYTDQPGLQFYSGNFLDGSLTGKGGKVYKKHYGFCLETQHFPDSPNHPGFPSVVLRPGHTYQTHTIYKFGVEK